jgi:hypothetical protein
MESDLIASIQHEHRGDSIRNVKRPGLMAPRSQIGNKSSVEFRGIGSRAVVAAR